MKEFTARAKKCKEGIGALFYPPPFGNRECDYCDKPNTSGYCIDCYKEDHKDNLINDKYMMIFVSTQYKNHYYKREYGNSDNLATPCIVEIEDVYEKFHESWKRFSGKGQCKWPFSVPFMEVIDVSLPINFDEYRKKALEAINTPGFTNQFLARKMK